MRKKKKTLPQLIESHFFRTQFHRMFKLATGAGSVSLTLRLWCVAASISSLRSIDQQSDPGKWISPPGLTAPFHPPNRAKLMVFLYDRKRS